jgi:hypothetical protein
LQPCLTARGNVGRHAGGPSRRQFLTSAGKVLRYSRTSLIRCALAVSRSVANVANSVVTAFPVAQSLRRSPSKAELASSMLPGLRFLFAAIVLSMSILVFGLGAAALLRAAHEEFASNPSWRAAPETTFAQPGDISKPVLTILSVEPPAAKPKAPETASVAAPAAEQAPTASMPAEPAANASTPAEPERTAALNSEDSSPPETAKPEIPATETSPQSEAAPAQAGAPASADAPVSAPVPAEKAKIAATEQDLPPPNEAPRAAPEQASAPASPDIDVASTKIATPGGPPVTIETPPPEQAANKKPDSSAIQERLQARRAARRRRIAQRAREAARQAQQQQVPANPFAQPTIAVRNR